MSLVDYFVKNAKKSLQLNRVDVTDSSIGYFFALFALYSTVRVLIILVLRSSRKDYRFDIEFELLMIEQFHIFLSLVIFAFLVRFLRHKKRTPYKQLLCMFVLGKVYLPLFLVLSAAFGNIAYCIEYIYEILYVVYLYQNLKPSNRSKIWFWILLVIGLGVAYIDMFDFGTVLLKFTDGSYNYGRIPKIRMIYTTKWFS